MNQKERNYKITDQAWNKLYGRLEQEGLIPDNETPRKTFFQSPGVKWAAGLTLLCISILTVIMLRNPQVVSQKMFTLHNQKDAPTLATTLEDGSIVLLSDYTTLSYPRHFGDKKREVNLSGDAFFDISKNKERPFVIDTESTTIEVLGTSFDVKAKDNQSFSLSVKNGEVKITLKKNGQSVNVKTGEKAWIESGQLRTKILNNNEDTDIYYSRIHFKDERLANVIRIINMNSDSLKLELSPLLENRQLTMTISKDSPVIIAELISLALDLQFIKRENTIFISEKK